MPRRLLWSLVVVALAAWLGASALTGPLAGKLSEVQTNDNASFLPSDAESTEVLDLQEQFQTEETLPAIVVVARDDALTPEDLQWTEAAVADLEDDPEVADSLNRGIVGPIPSEDRQALQLVVPINGDLGDRTESVVEDVRDRLDQDRPEGLDAYLTGPAGFSTDLGSAFAGIDGVLLLVALSVVLIILVLVYRSPVLPIAVLLSAVFALALASGVVYWLADSGALTLNGQSQGILAILVVGAATDYALLYVARYREELHHHRSRLDATKVAWRQSLEPIVASGMTVILALLCLLVSNLNSTRDLGPVAAIGLVASILSALTFLPALLAVLGRVAFWPRRPRAGTDAGATSGFWGTVADNVGKRPRTLWIGCAVVLGGLALAATTLKADGVSQSDIFLDEVEAVTGQEVLGEHFPGGSGSPTVLIGPADQLDEIISTAEDTDGVASATGLAEGGRPATDGVPVQEADGLVQVQAILDDPYDSAAALDTVDRLRTAVHHAVPGTKVGGQTATDLDTRDTAERDRALVIPLVLLVVLVLLALLLRAVVAAVLLLATVVLSYFATLGASALVFNHVLDWPGADPSVPLFGFVFLVALGVDYNIFLMSRVREETIRHGTREGILRGLAVTGGVITSAGIVLAATFSALVVIPLLFLAQLAFIVAFGVLLDTLVVRTVLVPSAGLELGDRLWWPSRLGSRATRETTPEAPEPATSPQ